MNENIIARMVNETLKKYLYLLKEDGEEKFRPTPEWMKKWYPIMNNELFDGSLGSCVLEVFTTGEGSNGGILGWFNTEGKNIFIDVDQNNRMFVRRNFRDIYIDKSNFVSLCEPTIKLNANYSATEQGWLDTLVHEMCHYYTYMNGYAPKQAHGVEFKNIAAIVAEKSNGRFPIQRVATAEQMKDFELDATIAKRNENKAENMKSKMNALVIIKSDNDIRLITTTSRTLCKEITEIEAERDTKDIRLYNDKRFIDLLYSEIKFKNFRSYRFYSLHKFPDIVSKLNDFPYEDMIGDSAQMDTSVLKYIISGNQIKDEIVNEIVDKSMGCVDSYTDEDEWSAINYVKNFSVSFKTPTKFKLTFKFPRSNSRNFRAEFTSNSITFIMPYKCSTDIGDSIDGYTVCWDGGEKEGAQNYFDDIVYFFKKYMGECLEPYIKTVQPTEPTQNNQPTTEPENQNAQTNTTPEPENQNTTTEPEKKESSPEQNKTQSVTFNGNFAITRDGNKFNIIDKSKRKMVFPNSVDNIWFQNNVWLYQDGKSYYMAKKEPYDWKKIPKKDINNYLK